MIEEEAPVLADKKYAALSHPDMLSGEETDPSNPKRLKVLRSDSRSSWVSQRNLDAYEEILNSFVAQCALWLRAREAQAES